MADSKITALTALTAADPANDMIPIVDVSDTPPASGNTKRISINNILACSPTATLASATITGGLTVQSNVNAPANVSLRYGPSGATWAGLRFDSTNQTFLDSDIALIFRTGGATSFTTAYQIGATGISTWSVGGSTAMTLNATGLGVGIVPSSFGRFSIQGTAGGAGILGMNTDATQCDIQSYNKPLAINRSGNNITMCEGGGNVGIGVTPSATAGKLQVFGTGDQTDENATLMVGSSSTNGMRLYTGVNNTNEYCYIGSVKSGVGYRTLKLQPNGGNAIICLAITPPTLSVDGDMVFNLTSNTNLRISVRGTDGTTRTANITLA